VSLLRAAAKAFPHVVVLSRPDQYPEFLERLAAGRLDLAYRRRLAAEALARTAAYDEQIAAYLAAGLEALDRPEGPEDALPASFPETYTLRLVRAASRRYGEYPHQAAAFHRPAGPAPRLPAARLLHGQP